jgi:hypothetical protein
VQAKPGSAGLRLQTRASSIAWFLSISIDANARWCQPFRAAISYFTFEWSPRFHSAAL